METASAKDYVQKSVPKSDDVKKLIHNAIKGNTLFKACSEEELVHLIEAFESADFQSGNVVIKQGDEGEHFYVVGHRWQHHVIDLGRLKGGNA